MREAKKYKLEARPRYPVKNPRLSGVGILATPSGQYTFYVSFSEAFVEAVGREMPAGVSPDHPAYLRVVHLPTLQEWRVYACYLNEKVGRLLWVAKDKPSWIKEVPSTE